MIFIYLARLHTLVPLPTLKLELAGNSDSSALLWGKRASSFRRVVLTYAIGQVKSRRVKVKLVGLYMFKPRIYPTAIPPAEILTNEI